MESAGRRLYGWAANDEGTLFQNVVCNEAGKSVAQQLYSHGAELSEEEVLRFFRKTARIRVNASDLTPLATVKFGGITLSFEGYARVFEDTLKRLLFVWEEGKRPAASVYTEEGIKVRIGAVQIPN